MKNKVTSAYTEDAVKGINSPTLQKSLNNIQNRFGKGALQYWKEMEDPQKRDRVKASRMRTLEHLDIVLTELSKNIRKRGGNIYFAKTRRDAIDYIMQVARDNGVKKVVKGKSMTSMEIGIDPVLEEDGIKVVETDLGEYIVQLAGDSPSHIIAPCIHLDREDIGKLFSEKLDTEPTTDPPELVKIARKALREELLSADMGLTGCNMACAETGQISLISNEGNIRMATTMPKIHVALMGMERVAATVEEQKEAIQLTTRGASLQKMSTYVSFSGGPKSADDPDSPEEFHLVVIDNGRSKILGDEDFREALACVRCGACLNICPVYGKIGGHAYNATYCGPIGAVITPLFEGINKHADLCKGETLCGACLDVCPVKNDIPRMLSVLRHKLAYGDDHWNVRQHNVTESYVYTAWQKAITHKAAYRAMIKTVRLLQKPFIGENHMIQKMAGLAAGWTKDRDLPPIAKRTFSEIWQEKYAGKTGTAQASNKEETND